MGRATLYLLRGRPLSAWRANRPWPLFVALALWARPRTVGE
jgi:hypothetical protein